MDVSHRASALICLAVYLECVCVELKSLARIVPQNFGMDCLGLLCNNAITFKPRSGDFATFQGRTGVLEACVFASSQFSKRRLGLENWNCVD